MSNKFTVHNTPPSASDHEIVSILVEALENVRDRSCHGVVIGLNMADETIVLTHLSHESNPKDIAILMRRLREHVYDAVAELKDENYGDGE